MSNSSFMDKLKVFLGIRQQPPRNDFRNPIWGSDDDDDGDELYTRHQIDAYVDPLEMQKHITKQMHEIITSFGAMMGDFQSYFNEDQFDSLAGFADIPESESSNGNNNIRDYYLKPGYQNQMHDVPKDMDLDGEISSNDISGLLKLKEDENDTGKHFNGNIIPGGSFCQTIITSKVTKPDGTIETRRIVKNGNKVVEEVTTSSGPDSIVQMNASVNSFASSGFIYNNIVSELSSLFKNYH